MLPRSSLRTSWTHTSISEDCSTCSSHTVQTLLQKQA